MKRAAIGIRTHSGWGALVAVTHDSGAVEIIKRRSITLIAPGRPESKQPYHFAEKIGQAKAERFLRDCSVTSEKLASAALRELIDGLRNRGYRVIGVTVLLAAGRPLPELSRILASHALIHSAEGEFFREAIRRACHGLELPVTGMRERDLDEGVRKAFGTGATRMRQRVDTVGRSLGPPWTKDQKMAALAALIALANKPGSTPPESP